MAIAVLGQGLSQGFELSGIDPVLPVGNFFRASDFESLAVFDGGDELTGFEQAFVGPGVEPGVATAHDFDVEFALFEIQTVEISNFQLTARRWRETFRQFNDLVVVKVQAGHRVVGFRGRRLFFETEHLAGCVKFGDTVALRILNMIGKNTCTLRAGIGTGQQLVEFMAVEDVVAEHQGGEIVADELFANDEGLGETIRAGLNGVLQIQAPARAVAEQLLETRCVLRCGDDQDVTDTSQHKGAERVVDHRLVVDRQ